MKINIESDDFTTLLTLSGKISATDFIELNAVLRTIDSYKSLHVICKDLNSLDASGLTLLCSTFMAVISKNNDLYVYNLSNQPKQLFDYLNITPIFTECIDTSELIPILAT